MEDRVVVKHNLDGEFDYYMMIDTAATVNILFEKGMKKMLCKNFDIYQERFKQAQYEYTYKPKNNIPEKKDENINVIVNGNSIITGNQNNNNTNIYNGEIINKPLIKKQMQFMIDPYGVFSTNTENNYIDGILGVNFLEQYNNVVFDYKNKTVKYNTKPISTNVIPMKKIDRLYYIPFSIGKDVFWGLIDTGNTCFLISEDSKLLTKDLTSYTDYITVEEVKIGNLTYDNLQALFASHIKYNGNTRSKEYIKYKYILGYPFFKDHIIQLDFENNVFRIK